jgi:predicted nucleic-acid-binding protein
VIAFDTNLLVRLAINDMPKQAEIAESLLESNQVFISRTVLLETEWVLRSRYKIIAEPLGEFFLALLNQENIVVENQQQVEQALKWYALGADFADAIHLAVCEKSTLYTFDKDFCKVARNKGITPGIKVLDGSL